MALYQSSLSTSLLAQKKKKEVPPPPSGAEPIDRYDYMQLVAKDGTVFWVHKQCARVSSTLKNYLEQDEVVVPKAAGGADDGAGGAAAPLPMPTDLMSPAGVPSKKHDVHYSEEPNPYGGRIAKALFRETSPELLEKAIQYMYYKFRYDSDPDHRPEFKVDTAVAVDLVQLADMLKC